MKAVLAYWTPAIFCIFLFMAVDIKTGLMVFAFLGILFAFSTIAYKIINWLSK